MAQHGHGVKKGYWGRKVENKPVNPPGYKPLNTSRAKIIREK